MSLPISRDEFKDYILRKLGSPTIQINVSDDQIEDRIDDALRYFMDFHFDGTERVYYKHQVTNDDKTNRYLTIPDNIIGMVKVFPLGKLMSTNNLFNIRYQLALNDLWDLTSESITPFFQSMQHINLLQEVLIGQTPIRYNRHTNKLYIDTDWNILNVDDWLVVEAFQVVDPETFTDVWGDRWLLAYATALVKEQWGSNLTKFVNVSLPGGMQFNGNKIYDDAVNELEKLKYEMTNTYSLPAFDMMG